MSQPTSGEVAAATGVLRSEADTWETESAAMRKLGTTVSGMKFNRLEAGIFQVLVGPYETLVQALIRRCHEAAPAMTDIGDALHGVADAYDAADKAAAQRLHKTTK